MDLAWLESFLALADAHSFTEAAARQHLSQPAFSRRIHALETYFGAALIDRSTYPAQLTHAGQQLHRQAAEWVRGARDLRNELRHQHTVPRNALRVATSHSLAAAFFPTWWHQISGATPQPCILTPSNTHDAYASLHAGNCDLLLTHVDPTRPIDIGRHHLQHTVGSDTFAPFSSTDHGTPRFTLDRNYPANTAAPLLGYAPGTFFGRILDQITDTAPPETITPPLMISSFTPALRTLAITGAGIAWLPATLAADDIDRGNLAPIADDTWQRPLPIHLYRARATEQPTPALDHIWHAATHLVPAAFGAAQGGNVPADRPARR